MDGQHLIYILCRLKNICEEFPVMKSSFIYEFDSRKYIIKFNRDEGRMMQFSIDDIGKSKVEEEYNNENH